MQRAMDETTRRREIQIKHNQKHNITPKTISKEIKDNYLKGLAKPEVVIPKIDFSKIPKEEHSRLKKELIEQMELAAANLEFEKAAQLRDQIEELSK